MKQKILMTLFGMLIGITSVWSQTDSTAPAPPPNSPSSGTKKLFLPGEAITMYQYSSTKGTPDNSSFTPVQISMFPLVKVSDRIFFDGGIQFGITDGGAVNVGLIEMMLYYRITPWMSAFVGNIAPHFGVYEGLLDDFTCRFGTGVAPVGMVHGPVNQNGVGIQGGFQAGYSKFTYQFYVVNGPQLITDTITHGAGNQSGEMSYGQVVDTKRAKGYGWHVGFLPFSNSRLELTYSGEYTPTTVPDGSGLQNVSSTAMAFGLNYYQVFNPVMVRVIAEYDMIEASNANYTIPSSTGTDSSYTYKNKQNGWFSGATLRATGSKNNFIKNMEIAGRLGAYNPPQNALWGGNQTTQTTFCVTEYLKWDLPLSLEYDVLKQAGSPDTKIFSAIAFFRF